MAASLWADDEAAISNDPLHLEMAEALELRPPYTPMNPTWLFEGTFEDWLSKTYSSLELSNKTDSSQTANDILNEVWCDFLRRQELPSGKALTVPDLLHMLRIHCTEFRLLGLPLELRELVYDMAFEKTHDPEDCDCEHPWGTHDFNPSQVTVAESYDSFWEGRRKRIGNPKLLHVSRQVRSEAGKVYYRSKQFHLYVDLHMSANPEKQVNTWLQTVVGEFATHLRDLTMRITYFPETNGLGWARIRAQYRPGHGLKIAGSVEKINEEWETFDEMLTTAPLPFVGVPAYVARLENIRAAYKEQGEIIARFFEDWEELRQACSGPNEELMYLSHDYSGRRYEYWGDEATVV
ncbi:hypothetical protein Q7P36_002702 [Cladosporium allicinum]